MSVCVSVCVCVCVCECVCVHVCVHVCDYVSRFIFLGSKLLNNNHFWSKHTSREYTYTSIKTQTTS